MNAPDRPPPQSPAPGSAGGGTGPAGPNGARDEAPAVPMHAVAGGFTGPERRRSRALTPFDQARLRRAEDRLYRRELEFKTLVENSPDIVSRIDREMRHLYVNPAIEKAFGLPAAAYYGHTKRELGFPQNVIDAWEAEARAAFASREERQFIFRFEDSRGVRHFSTRLIPEPDRQGRIASLLAITYDITERARMEAEREELLSRERSARIQAETAARARDEFLAIVSHELRAPLNGIQSWAHVLESYAAEIAASPLALRALQGIRTGVSQQVRLVEDLLDVTGMMSGKLRLARHPFALLPVLSAAMESVVSCAQAKAIILTADLRLTDERVDGDPDRVQQIVWNLLSNAIKFTPEGGAVSLSAECREHRLRLTVRDTGVGIAHEFLPRLFDRFSQQDTSSTRKHSGLGLGLFLVRHLVALHGGAIEAHSEGLNKGATFTVILPQCQIGTITHDSAASLHATMPSLSGMRILIIDDQAEARESLTAILSGADADAMAAPSAIAAVRLLEDIDAANGSHDAGEEDTPGRMPDFIICDIAMPDEDGYMALRRLRTWQDRDGSYALKRVPALALTAFSQREDRLKALSAGFQIHMAKPVAPDELIIAIATMRPVD